MTIRPDLSFEDVYETIKYGRDQIDINSGIFVSSLLTNEGFMKQLHEYYDELHPTQSSPADEAEPPIDTKKPDLVVDAKEWMLDSLTKGDTKPTTNYACKNCRSILFSNLDLKEHEQGKGNSAFRWAKRE